MATRPELIFCAAGNRQYTEFAIASGFRYGARLPSRVYYPIWFADQNWRRPDRSGYMRALEAHRPYMATVLDWEQPDQLPEVLDWAEEASQWTDAVLIVPKVIGAIERLPRSINARPLVLAYSVPTRYGASPLPLWELAGWPVHLLGGSPMQQMHVYLHLRPITDVISADGNMLLTSSRYGVFFDASRNCWATRDPRIPIGPDLCYRAFERSCQEIVRAWDTLVGG